MIVIGDRDGYFQCYRTGVNELEPIGVFHKRKPESLWEVAFIGRDWSFYDRLLDGNEKTEIIDLLDKLNGETKIRSWDGTLAWWRFIIGIPDATI